MFVRFNPFAILLALPYPKKSSCLRPNLTALAPSLYLFWIHIPGAILIAIDSINIKCAIDCNLVRHYSWLYNNF